MYSVVIVDDEELIVRGLKSIVPWQEYACFVAAVAYDGVTGAETIRRFKPDMVLCDIRMPGQDGLTMLAGLRSEYPDMQITVISGYRDFEYARRALELGAVRYLLKPTKLEEIREALAAMTEKISRGPDTEPEIDSFVVRGALKYIREHIPEKFTLQDVADQVYVSSWHLCKLFKKHMGENFSEICRRERVEQAKRLLRDPSLRVHEVADMTGFSDVTHFSKVFKRIVGLPAGEYRNTEMKL